ncbi:YDG domain-containing protein [Mucilaginibacter sp.]|uniref:YDG domain-containing protein n=1 Tax=Mucilaginibacter sp. TaxID=1882438 RepID=UPI002852CAC6|nr:YDG domain-containing protein [Mucilaginibacter sp.]
MSNLILPGKAMLLCLLIFATANLFLINQTFATNYQLPAASYGAQTGAATYGTVSSVTYTISYSIITASGSANQDQLALAWTSGAAPAGVTYTLTTGLTSLGLSGGNNAAASFLPTLTGTKTITLTITTSSTTPTSTAGYGFTLTTTDNNGGVSGSSTGLTLVVTGPKTVTAIATGSQTGTATFGTAAPSITYANTLTETGTTAPASNSISVAWSGGTPTGVTTAFTAGTQAMTSGTAYTPNGTNGSTITLTVSTTATTPAGTYNFTVTNVDNNGGGTTTSTGTLVVGSTAKRVTAVATGSQTGTATFGTAAPSITYTNTLTETGTTAPASNSISVAWSGGTPTGVTTAFTAGTQAMTSGTAYTPNGTNGSTITLTVSTTTATPAGTYNFTVTNVDNNGGGTTTSTGTLVVLSPPKSVTAIATGSQTGTAIFGTAAPSITYTNTLTETGTSAPASNSISLAWSGGTPTGVTTAFTSGTQAMTSGTAYTPNGTNGSTITLTVSTTAVTPAGSYNFTVTNVDNNGGGTTTSTGTLVVVTSPRSVTALATGSQTGTAIFGTAAPSITYTNTLTEIGTTTAVANSISVAWSGGTPTGVTTAFTSGTQAMTSGTAYMPNGANGSTITLTVSTTAATPVGTYTFTVTNVDNNGGGTTTSTGTLVVMSPPKRVTAIATGSQTGTATYGTAAGAITYVNTLTETGTGTAVANSINIGWSGGTPTGVTAVFTAGTQGMTTGTTYTPNGTNGSTITLTVSTTTATPAGTYNFTVTNMDNNGGGTTTSIGTLVVGTKALIITANNQTKVYGTAFTFAGTEFTASGLVGSDAVTSATITSAGAASTAAVAGSPYTITASAALGNGLPNYSISYIDGTFTVTPKALTMPGAAGASRVYDGTTLASVTGGTLSGIISPDVVTINAACTFATANAGTGIVLTFYIGGASAGNYTLTQPGTTANITPKALTETGATAANKVYDGTTTATITGGTLIGVVSPDVVSVSTTGVFANANVGTGITVTIAITGASAGNYTLTQPGITANITPKALTITGATISNKSYDGTTTASISGTASLVGIIGTDVVTLGGTPIAVFASQNVATGISVTVTGYALSGASAGNYTITQPSGLTANITTATLNIVATGPTKLNNTTQANLSGAASVGYFNYYGTVPGESITSVTLTLSSNAAQTAGSAYTVTPSLPVGAGGFNISNYSITYSVYNGIVAGHIYTWTGAANTTSWTTTGNWSSSPTGGTYPGNGVTYDGVILPSGTTYTPTLSSNITVNTLTYTGNNTLTIASGIKLISTNSFIVNAAATNANLTFSGASTSTILELSSSVFSNYGGFNISGTGLLQVDNTGSYIYNGGTVTANGNCTLYLQGGSNVTHALTNAGIFYAGTANSNCNIEMDDYGSIENSGSFYLGPTSLMYYYNDNAQYVIINNQNGGTFTLQSNANGSATIGEIPQGKNNAFTGTFNVERYFQGSTTVSLGRYVERNYRIISSCVNTGTTVNGNYVYGLNYIVGSTAGQTTTANSATNAFITGCTGGSTSGGNPSIYLYNESKTPSNQTFTSGNFLGITNITNSTTGGTITASDGGTYGLPVGTGVFFFFRGAATNWATRTVSPYIAPDNVTLTSTGNMNVGSYTYKDWYTPGSANLGYTGTGTSSSTNYAVRGFNMLGNPYPCAIDWLTSYSGSGAIVRTNISPTIWVFNPVTSQYDTYQATSSTTGTATGNASRYIASGQGFVVLATTTNPALTISEYAKVVLNNNGVAGTGAVPAGAKLTGSSLLMSTAPIQTAVPQSFRLKLVTDSINYDDIVIGFHSSASTNYDPYEDGKFLPGTNAPESLASFSSDGIKLSINNLPLPKLTPQVIKLFVTAKAYGTYTLQRTDLQAIPKIYDVWLMDKFKKDSLDIRNNPTYTFDITTDTTSYGNNRFQLVIRQNPALGIHLLNFTATKAQNGAQAVWVTENEENYTNFTIERSTDGGNTFTVLGGYASSALGTYSFLDKNPANGANMYRLKIEDINGTISYSNVVTVMYGNSTSLVKTGIVVYPNPVKSMLNLSIAPGFNTNATPSIAYSIQITNILGAVVTQSTTNAQNWQTDVSSLMPGTYVITVINTSNSTTVGHATFIKL